MLAAGVDVLPFGVVVGAEDVVADVDVLPFGVVVGANVAVGVKEVVSLPNKPEIVETIDAIKLVFEVVVKPVASLDVSVPDTFKDDTFEVAPFVVTVVFLVVVVVFAALLLPPPLKKLPQVLLQK